MLDKYKYLFLVKHNTMKKKHSITIAFLGILLAFSSCQAIKLTKVPRNPDTSLLFICKDNGGLYSNRIYVSLENRETHEKYESTAIVGYGSVVYNLPKGTYDVIKVWFEETSGYTVLSFSNWSPELTAYFGPIEIEPNNNYFLGIYECYKDYDIRILWTVRDQIKMRYMEPGSNKHIGMGQDYVPIEIRKEIAKSNWKDGEFIMLRPAKYDEVFDFY